MKTILNLICAGSLVLGASTSWALSRPTKKIGIGMAFVGDPAPSLTSYQLRYNITGAVQLSANYGKVGVFATTYGVGARAFLIPSWNFSPYVGAGYSMAKTSGNLDFGGTTVNTGSKTLSSIVASAGLDHQSNIGFNIGVGVNYFITPTEIKDVVSMLPNFHFAWFF